MKKTRILLADDHAVVVEGLRTLLEKEFDVVGTARDGMEVLAASDTLRPEILLLDLSMPLLDGISVVHRLRKTRPEIKIVILTMHSDLPRLKQALRAGACGFLHKTCAPDELRVAIREVACGRTYLSPVLSADVVRAWLAPSEGILLTGGLTLRNREILKLIAEGRSNKEIASLLGISVKTVEFHKSRMMRKLGLRTTADLIRYAARHGIGE